MRLPPPSLTGITLNPRAAWGTGMVAVLCFSLRDRGVSLHLLTRSVMSFSEVPFSLQRFSM